MLNMSKYRKRPVLIDAFQYDGDLINSKGEFCVPEWAELAYKTGKLFYGYEGLINDEPPVLLFVKTAKGRKLINVGDYVVMRNNGEISPYKKDKFEQMYESVEK